MTAAILLAAATITAGGANGLDGLYGMDLKAAVTRGWQPATLPQTEIGGEQSMWSYFRTIDASPKSGNVVDIYSLDECAPSGAENLSVDGMTVRSVLPAFWWTAAGQYGVSPLCRDLTVNRPVMTTTSDIISVFRFVGPVQTENERYDRWRTGYYTAAGGIEVPVHEPPAETRGDIARAIFYAVTVYPPRDIEAEALHVLDGNDYPGLAPIACSTLLQWHREDPVNDAERRRDSAVAAIQGCGNPFVEYPELAEHIWGDLSTTPFCSGSDNPEIEPNPIPLRPDYSVTDARIDLMSPYVPPSAEWTVDGRQAVSPLVPAELGPGVHELRYRTPDGERGKILITIR